MRQQLQRRRGQHLSGAGLVVHPVRGPHLELTLADSTGAPRGGDLGRPAGRRQE